MRGSRGRIDFAGNCSLSIATGGVAPTAVVRFANAAAGALTATMYPARPLAGSLDTVYGTAGANCDANAGRRARAGLRLGDGRRFGRARVVQPGELVVRDATAKVLAHVCQIGSDLLLALGAHAAFVDDDARDAVDLRVEQDVHVRASRLAGG